MPSQTPTLPDGLTTRPLRKSDAHDVFVLAAAQEQEDIGEVAIEEADIVSDWAKPSHDLGAPSVGVWGGDTLVAYAALMGRWRPLRSGLVAVILVGALAALDWVLFTRASLWLATAGAAALGVLAWS